MIADFLSAIDLKIGAIERTLEALKQYKRGAAEKIFNREIRFHDKDGKEFPEWRFSVLGKVSEIFMGQSPDSESYNDSGE